ncbi:MAG: DnaJ domain-containing protein [Pseudomonadota bacterium]
MLPQLALLLGFLAVAFLAVRWFTRANPASVSRTMKMAGLAALVALGAWLVLTGKLAGLFAVAAGLAPWIMRALRLHALWRMLRQFGARMAGGQASAGNASSVETRFLSMTLDHDTGALDGTVVAGRFTGRALSSLDFAQAVELWHDVQSDPQSAQVLEAWLDRTWPDWRGTGGGEERPAATGAMSRDEAWEILGLAPGAPPEEIKAAHRRLMRQVHPDHGGSTWLAARINQARDLLLDA